MLIRFRVSNFRSIKDEQELSMVAGSLAGPNESLVQLNDQGLVLLRVAAIYGANAAGKSNVLGALRFMSGAVVDSHRTWKPEEPIPRQPFLLDPASRAAPSQFEADFLLDGVRFRYGFRLNAERILEEWLYSFPGRRRRLWFRRNSQAGEPFEFGKSLRGSNRTIASLARDNSLFLSVAAENNHEMMSPVRSWLAKSLVFDYKINNDTVAASEFSLDREGLVLHLLRLADLGIAGIETKEISGEQAELSSALLSTVYKYRKLDPEVARKVDFSALRVIQLRHSSPADPSGITLPFEMESQGTRAWLALAHAVLNVLETGAVLCVDELDRSLHPRLALEVVRMFEDPIRNSKNAQLIFNTHDTTLLGNLLGGSGLRRDQVWFVEKDAAGATNLYSLSDFRPRRDENLERGYLQGRYGAVPFIGPAPFVESGDE